MYYEINEETKKVVNIQGFHFTLKVKKITQFEVNISIETLQHEVIDEININEMTGFDYARDYLGQAVFNWLEENTDEADNIITAVMTW